MSVIAVKPKKAFMVRRGTKYEIQRHADGTFGGFVKTVGKVKPKQAKKAGEKASEGSNI